MKQLTKTEALVIQAIQNRTTIKGRGNRVNRAIDNLKRKGIIYKDEEDILHVIDQDEARQERISWNTMIRKLHLKNALVELL